MTSATFTFSLLTPTKSLFSGEVRAVRLSTDVGDLELLAGHADLVGIVTASRVEVDTGASGHTETFFVRQGTVSYNLDAGKAQLVVYSAEPLDSTNHDSLKQFHAFIHELLAKPEMLNDYQIRYLEKEALALERTIEIVEVK